MMQTRQYVITHAIVGNKNDPNKKDHALNALKYCSSLFPIFIGMSKKLPSKEEADSL